MIRASPYRAAVIGRTGRGDYGHGLDRAMVDHPDLKLVAVADDDPRGLAEAAMRLGLDRAYADYREMLDREKPQIVAVGPIWLDRRLAMIRDCAERGIHVFCEKPMAADLADADAIVDACARSHVKLAVAFQTRYSDRFERVRDRINDGAIGEVLELRGRGKEDHRGGGEDLLILGSHIMDLDRAFLGEATWCFARVTDRGRPVTRGEVRDVGRGFGPVAGDRIDAIFGFRDTPVVAHFATSRPKEGANRRFGLEILGSKGRITLTTGGHPDAFLLADPSWSGARSGTRWEPIAPEKGEPGGLDSLIVANRAILADLVDAIEHETEPKVGAADGRASLEMILACYAAHAAGASVPIPLVDRAEHPLRRLGRGT